MTQEATLRTTPSYAMRINTKFSTYTQTLICHMIYPPGTEQDLFLDIFYLHSLMLQDVMFSIQEKENV